MLLFAPGEAYNRNTRKKGGGKEDPAFVRMRVRLRVRLRMWQTGLAVFHVLEEYACLPASACLA